MGWCAGDLRREKNDHEMVILLLNRSSTMAFNLFKAVGKHRF